MNHIDRNIFEIDEDAMAKKRDELYNSVLR
jgi:hypothetical protein